MPHICRWLVNLTSKNWASLSGKPLSPTFMDTPADVFVNICEWLSVRDILALRMTNKCVARVTYEPVIWNSLLRRLFVPLPILPVTSGNRFGVIGSQAYEKLLLRAIYLEQNWRRQHPVASHSYFEVHDRTLRMKMLPGGKYMVTMMKNLVSGVYSLTVWDMDDAGRRVALVYRTSAVPFLMLEVKYGVINGSMSIVIAYANPPVKTRDETFTTVSVSSVPISVLERLAMLQLDVASFRSYADTLECPFNLVHLSKTPCEVGELALGDFDGEMVLLVVHRPRALVFHYINSGRRGSLLLGPIEPYTNLLNSIWTTKLLPSQNSVLVGRVLVENGVSQDSTLFALDMFLLPDPGSSDTHPRPMGRQMISGLRIDGFYFSDLEMSWFASLRDPGGMLPSPMNKEPPPITIFITTVGPRGFVQCLLRPEPIPNQYISLPDNRGMLERFVYSLPAVGITRDVWTDDYARPVVHAGAYRSIIWMRPHVHPSLSEEAPRGIETLRFCTYATRGDEYEAFSTPRATGNVCTATDGEEMEVEEVESPPASRKEWDDPALQKRSLRIPLIPNEVAWDMMHGTTAIAFDESVGRMCVATNQDTAIHVLDFGGGSWEVAVVEP